MYWVFDQNNSGGSFDIYPKKGIGPRVWIEADSLEHAIDTAETIGIYFHGVSQGIDCECCGDRWYEPFDEEGEEEPTINQEYDFVWHDTVYVHRIDGTIEHITKGSNK